MGESATLARRGASRPWWRRVIRALVIAYVTVCMVVFFLQNYLVFPGATTTHGQADTRIGPGKDYELLTLDTPDGNKIAAIFGTALDGSGRTRADAGTRPTIIYFYGNGACMAWSLDLFNEFRFRGFNIIIPEYEGYGMSEGKPSETGCYAAADAAYDYLLTRRDVRRDKIVLVGWSLGGAVAIDLANRKPVAGVATLSAFTNMKEMAHRVIPWLPSSLLVRYRFDNLAKISNLRCPLFIAHGTRDDIVPPYMADRLAAAAKAQVTQVRVEGASHDIFEIDATRLLNQIQQFIDGL
jgi:fermentation-respiration switch protein FrsA (DUF1100 family)